MQLDITTSNPVLEALDRRHATKLFDASRQIPAGDFTQVLQAARVSPTSFGLELYEIILLQPAHRALFREKAWGANGALTGTEGQLGSASHFGIITAYNERRARYDSPYLYNFLRTVKGYDEAFTQTYIGILKTFMTEEFDLTDDRKLTDWTGKQAYIALANMMTTAASLGIDSCPVEGFDQATAKRILAEELDVDMSYQEPAVMFAFGYRAEEPRYARTRRELDKIVRWL